jgi:hypothetical protein
MTRKRPPHEQVSTVPTSLEWIMSQPQFEYGVNDKRAGRGRRLAYDTWSVDAQWNYERGRVWATLAPRSIPLKLPGGRLNPAAVRLANEFDDDIL